MQILTILALLLTLIGTKLLEDKPSRAVFDETELPTRKR